jgi:SAM-dependent methyltransferase
LNRHHDRFRGRLLDVGCGMKPFESVFGAHVTEWHGIDQQESASGRTRADQYVDLRHPLPLRDADFDVVLCTQVLEHVPDPFLVMRELARVLRPGGVVLLSAPQTFPRHEEPHDYFRYTNHGLRHMAQEVGLEVAAMEPMGSALVTVAQQVVWHMVPMTRLPVVGRRLYGWTVAAIQTTVLVAEKLAARRGNAGSESTIGHLLVAEKPVETTLNR